MTHDTQIVIRISKQLVSELDLIRRTEEDVPSRAEMLRRMIDMISDARSEAIGSLRGAGK